MENLTCTVTFFNNDIKIVRINLPVMALQSVTDNLKHSSYYTKILLQFSDNTETVINL